MQQKRKRKKKGSIYNLSNTCKIIYKQIVSQNKRINYSKDDNKKKLHFNKKNEETLTCCICL